MGSDKYKDEYLASKVDEWVRELEVLLEITKTQLQAVYCGFITGFCHKITNYMRSIKGASAKLRSID